jgi:thiosulfate/3-mercaptopyruvate sulfurtransferase
LEPWEKVLVDADTFPQTVHGHIPCTQCHAGVQSAEKEIAHEGLVARPSESYPNACSDCHEDIAGVYKDSLHNTQDGYWTVLEARSVPENHAQLEEMFGNHCARCHSSCGDCHIGQPASVGGGLFEGHNVVRTPPMTRSCTACHGSRVGNEYLGKNEEIPGDVHFREGRMNCVDCHDNHELHGQPGNCSQCHPGVEDATIPPADHRYAGLQSPTCESCHPDTTLGKDNIEMHTVHGADLSCQVCHSVSYTSCDSCHVALSETSGNPYFETQGTYLTFLIGLNPTPSYTRPYKYVPVRHIPIDPQSFSFYGENLLPNFNQLPNWAYATPHNIQRSTPQAESCNACHGNPGLFLTADKVKPEELEANQRVIVPQVPAAIPEETSNPSP